MSDHLEKHIEVFSGGMIYHYSNSRNNMVKQTPEAFSKHYRGSNVPL
jgi:hypothetical protein